MRRALGYWSRSRAYEDQSDTFGHGLLTFFLAQSADEPYLVQARGLQRVPWWRADVDYENQGSR